MRYPHLQPYDGDYSPPGWALLVSEALESLAAIEATPGLRSRVSQVKEKFGGLKLYAFVDDDRPEGRRFTAQLREIVQAAEQRAARTWQTCGAPGELRSPGVWWATVCAKHIPRGR